MKRQEYERLAVMLQQVLSDRPPDQLVVRHAKGLLVALYGWLAKGRPAQHPGSLRVDSIRDCHPGFSQGD